MDHGHYWPVCDLRRDFYLAWEVLLIILPARFESKSESILVLSIFEFLDPLPHPVTGVVSSSAEQGLESLSILRLLPKRRPVPLGLDWHPLADGNLAPLLQLLALVLGRDSLALQQRAVDRLKAHAVTGAQEVNQPVPVEVLLVLGRRHDAVHTALEVAVGPEMQHVGRVDNDAAGDMLDIGPSAIGQLQLQTTHGLREDKGDAAKVGVAADVDVLVLVVDLGGPRVVLDVAQKRRAVLLVPVVLRERLLGYFEHQCQQTQHLGRDMLVHVAVEALNIGVALLHKLGVRPLMLGDELEDMVAFPVIPEPGELLNGAQRAVSIVVTVFNVGTVLELLFLGEVEDLTAQLELGVDVLLAKAKVGHVKEA